MCAICRARLAYVHTARRKTSLDANQLIEARDALLASLHEGQLWSTDILWMMMLVVRAGCSSEIPIVRSRAIFTSLGLLLALVMARTGRSTNAIAIMRSRAICAPLGRCS